MNISQRLRACAKHTGLDAVIELLQEAADEIDALQARAALTQQPATGERLMGQVSLPDGSAFAIASFPLPKGHWLYAPREYATGAGEPLELPAPILTHGQREAVVAAIRYAVRGATMCGREQDFDPDAMVQNAVYALCGPYARVSAENTQTSVNLALSQQPATGEPVAWIRRHPNGALSNELLIHVQVEQVRRDSGAWVPLYTRPAPSVPDDVVRVPVQVLKDASEALGNFVSDHGWGDADMQAMDNLDAYIARHDAKAQK